MRAENLCSAVFRKDLREVQRLLARHSGLVIQCGPGGLTALHAAALVGFAEAVPVLAGAGVPLEAALTDAQAVRSALAETADWPANHMWVFTYLGNGCTALHLAAWMDEAPTVRALLAAGANVDAEEADSYSPIGLILELSLHSTTMALLEGGASLFRPLHRFNGRSIMRQAGTKWLCGTLVECVYRRQLQREEEQQQAAGQWQQQQPAQSGQRQRQAAGQAGLPRQPRRSRRLQAPPPPLPPEAQQPLTGQQAADVLLATAQGSTCALFSHFLAVSQAADQGEAARGVAGSLLSRASDSRDPGMVAAVLESGLCAELAPAQLAGALTAVCVPGRLEAAQALLQHGAPVSLGCVRQVVEAACSAASWAAVLSAYSIRTDRLEQAAALLELLLRHGQPQVDLGSEEAPVSVRSCPFYTLAQAARRVESRFGDGAAEACCGIYRGLLQLAETLAGAGYSPTRFRFCRQETGVAVLRDHCPFDEVATLLLPDGWLHGALEVVARHTHWTPERHARFPTAVRAAARTLLLAQRRGRLVYGGAGRSRTRRGSAELRSNPLQTLPPEVLHYVLALAARPLSAWV